MNSVQRLRHQAQAAGNLQSNQYQNVTVQAAPAPSSAGGTGQSAAAGNTTIIIEPADPQVVYVPSYNPNTTYGTWQYPASAPVYYPPPPAYYAGSALVAGLAFGTGVAIINSLWGDCDWDDHDIDIDVDRYNNINNIENRIDNSQNKWQHNAVHRDGVPYRDARSREQYGRQLDGARQRAAYRGDDAQRAEAENAPGLRWTGTASNVRPPPTARPVNGHAKPRLAIACRCDERTPGSRPSPRRWPAPPGCAQAAYGLGRAGPQQCLRWRSLAVASQRAGQPWTVEPVVRPAARFRAGGGTSGVQTGQCADAQGRRAAMNLKLLMGLWATGLAWSCIASAQQAFPTPEKAVEAFVQALGVEHPDEARLAQLLGEDWRNYIPRGACSAATWMRSCSSTANDTASSQTASARRFWQWATPLDLADPAGQRQWRLALRSEGRQRRDPCAAHWPQ